MSATQEKTSPPPCFVCTKPTVLRRSLTKPKSQPLTEKDAVHICTDCIEDWENGLNATEKTAN